MKYVITDRGEVASGARDHRSLAAGLKGKVVGAGHYRVVAGRIEVFGGSLGFAIRSRPGDAALLARHLALPE
jgi:hypothetical protein